MEITLSGLHVIRDTLFHIGFRDVGTWVYFDFLFGKYVSSYAKLFHIRLVQVLCADLFHAAVGCPLTKLRIFAWHFVDVTMLLLLRCWSSFDFVDSDLVYARDDLHHGKRPFPSAAERNTLKCMP